MVAKGMPLGGNGATNGGAEFNKQHDQIISGG